MNTALTELIPIVGTQAACNALGVVRSSYYRQRPKSTGALPPTLSPHSSRPAPARALSPEERATVLAYLHP